MDKQSLINQISEKEWSFFDKTQNIGSRAICQDKKENFILSRTSYLNIYNEGILKSYLYDLIQAEYSGINLVSQKYGYMMEVTDQENYQKIKELLEPISKEKSKIIDNILPICMKWEEEIQKKYANEIGKVPNLNRSLYNDTQKSTSVKTYLKGELSTYSIYTLKLILSYFIECEKINNNLILKSTQNLYESQKFI